MQSIFKRYEKKYLISKDLALDFQKLLLQHMDQDRFSGCLVQNLYYDTENWDIIRTSIERPLYKEKMRLRCYDVPDSNSKLFLELKKKFKGTIYKRRMAIPFIELSHSTIGDIVAAGTSQISREFNFTIKKSDVSEKIYIAYRRTAFTGQEDTDLRITFDSDIHCRLEQLDFLNPGYGSFLLPEDIIVMEIKVFGGMPLWLARGLSECTIFPGPFSKYGKCYTDFILKQVKVEKEEKTSA